MKPPSRFKDYEMVFYALHIAEQIELTQPSSYTEAVNGLERKQWIQTMKEEIDSLMSNKT